MPIRYTTAAVLGLSLSLAGPALAETRTASIEVRAQFNESCTASASPLEFGEMLRQFKRTIVITGTLAVDCSEKLPYRIALDAGQHYDAATPQNRRLAGPNGAYSLYTVLMPNAGSGGPIWGDQGLGDTLTAGAPFSSVGNGNGLVQRANFTAVTFGVVPGNGNANGSYTDTLTMTIAY